MTHEIAPSAHKHGIAPDDIDHALRNAIVIEPLDDDRRLLLGPARDGAVLELVAIDRSDDVDLVIHAMAMRPNYRRLLPGG